MTVILMLLTFVTFLTVEHFVNRNKKKEIQVPVFAAKGARDMATPRLQPQVVAGFKVPDNLRYHQGHTWALSESPNLVRVGVDDFAAKVIGQAERVQVPQRGQWIRQGQKIFAFRNSQGELVEMVSPIEGAVADVNMNLLKDPALVTRDSYGEGWMVTVTSPDAKTNYRNLMGGTLARAFTEEAAARLRALVPTMAAGAMADGGEAAADLSKQLPAEKYAEIVHEFFLA